MGWQHGRGCYQITGFKGVEKVGEIVLQGGGSESGGVGDCPMGWQRFLGSLQISVSFAEEPYKNWDSFSKRPAL